MRLAEEFKKRVYEPYQKRSINYSALSKTVKDKAEFRKKFERGFEKVVRFVDKKQTEFAKLVAHGGTDAIRAAEPGVRGLADFMRINLAGIKKLLERHDKEHGGDLKGEYKSKLKDYLRESKSVDELLAKVCSALSRQRKAHAEKYWVPEREIAFVRMGLARHMREDMTAHKEATISSIYFDSCSLANYSLLLCGMSKADVVKMSWEGNSRIVLVERVRGDDCPLRGSPGLCSSADGGSMLAESRAASSFYIKDDDVERFLRGEDTLSAITAYNEPAHNSNNSDHAHNAHNVNNADDTIALKKAHKEIQQLITTQKLRPILRTVCKRTVVAARGIEAVIESRIAMIRECSEYEAEAGLVSRQWRRTDICGEWPYGRVKDEDIVRFPHALLKLSFSDQPAWLGGLLDECGAERVDVFSKTLHGVASLFSHAEPTPYWMARLAAPMDETAAGTPAATPAVSAAGTPRPVMIPVRVEPKVFFANERTFLSWVQFAIFLGGIGTAMLGLGNDHASICGVLLIIVASIFSIYSLYLFHWRLQRIREKDPGPYDDRYGPTILVCVFLVAIFLSFIFKMPLKHGYKLN
ncbi:hypothetical protein PAPHI01_1149 [Pancytospora philotis]|nr:hypothetical protein PAPHI01_1149 [Pancytospora philotis]